MAFVPLLSDAVDAALRWLARTAGGGVLLIAPSGDIAFVRGDVTPDARQLVRTNAHRATDRLHLTSCFLSDAGSCVQVLSLAEGWVLGIEMRDVPAKLPTSFRLVLGHVLETLTLWLAYAHAPPPGGHKSGQGGAPAEAFAARPPKRPN